MTLVLTEGSEYSLHLGNIFLNRNILGRKFKISTRGPFGRDLSDIFKYSEAVRKALNDIVKILPQPVSVATTKRLSGIFTCKADLVNYRYSV